jgi:hypothetical protein
MMLYLLCGPSGAGKSTLQGLLLKTGKFARLTTFTTRARRAGEVDGLDYHFLPSHEQFQTEVQVGHIVCPIHYRGEWYGTAREDLLACAERATLAVLRPDKIPALAQYTPLVGIYIERVPGTSEPCTEDTEIYTHKHLCSFVVANVEGDPSLAVEQILALIEENLHAFH